MPTEVEEKRCSGCDTVKPFSDFSRHPKGRYGLRSHCRGCCSERAMARNDASPDIQLNAYLLRKFGISLVEYNALLEGQGGVCAICKQPPTIAMGKKSRRQGRAVRPRLVVDHCHETGRIRGLLCTPCNRGIGFLGDDVGRVQAALLYLERGP